MSFETITYEKEDSIAIVTLNRPERLNAWTDQMNADIVHAIDNANEDKDIGAVVVTGAGRGYCAGADIKDSFHGFSSLEILFDILVKLCTVAGKPTYSFQVFI